MKIILSIIAALIVYGSLYPFEFSFEPLTQANIQALFDLNIVQTRLSDLVANVVLFIPFGLVLRATFPTYRSWHNLAMLLVATFIFAFAIQVMQLWTVGRLPWGGDAIWNLAGCLLGFVLYSVIKLDAFHQVITWSVVKQVTFVLALLLITLKLAPFAPSIDFQLLKNNIKALLANPRIDVYSVFEYTIFWLVTFYFIAFTNARWAHIFKLALLVFIILGLKFIIISSYISFSQMLAGALALGIWFITSSRINLNILAALMFLAILGNGLHPFELRASPGGFNWIPFAASLNGNFLINIIALSSKLVFYGSSIWLVYLITNKLRIGAFVCLSLVLLSEFLQTMVVDSVPDITDSVLVLFIVYIFASVLKFKTKVNQQVEASVSNPVDKHVRTSKLSSFKQDAAIETQGKPQISGKGADSGRNNMVKRTNASTMRMPTTNDTKTGSKTAKMGMQKITKIQYIVGVIALILVLIVGLYFTLSSGNSISINQPYWAHSKDKRLIFDPHTHTQYSDGNKSISEVTDMAYTHGCDAFAITDHSQYSTNFSSAKVAEVEQMRTKFSEMLIINGIELGMPSYDGREHVNILTTPEFEEPLLNAVMENLFNSSHMQAKQRDLHVLAPIQRLSGAYNNSFVVYNHPSREVANKNGDENLKDIKFWNQDFPLITALSGAPGHQKSGTIGSYTNTVEVIDRWDPVVAEVGGTWDKLLAQGMPIWGAIASSDYHNDSMDFAPCEFSRIHVAVPSKDYKGLFKGLNAGTFWADQGHLLNMYDLSVSVDSEQSDVYPGGTLNLSNSDNVLAVNLQLQRNELYLNEFLRADLITNCGAEKVIVKSSYMPPEKSQLTIFVPVAKSQESCFLRSRVVKETAEDNDFAAYSNPIFVKR